MPKVVFLTSAHNWNDARIYHRHARTLDRAGVTAVIVAPVDTEKRRELLHSDIRVVPVARFSARWLRASLGAVLAIAAALRESGAVYVVNDPELIPWISLLRTRGPVVFDAHEDLPRQVLAKHYLPMLLRRAAAFVAQRLCDHAARRCALVLLAGESVRNAYPRASTVLIRNFPEVPEWEALPAYESRLNAACYIGLITDSRGAKTSIDGFESARIPEWSLHMFGPVRGAELPSMLRDGARAHITSHGVVAPDIAQVAARRYKVGLAILHPTPAHLEGMPTKLFEYMACGTPVIASNFPVWSDFMRTSGAGICVDPLDVEAIAAAFEVIASSPETAAQMGRLGHSYAYEHCNWANEGQRLVETLTNVWDDRRSPKPSPQ